jgi:signal peptidase I
VSDVQTDRIFDKRVFFTSRIIKLLIIAAVALLIKFCFIDATAVRNDQMLPTIYPADQILVFKTFSLPVVKDLFRLSLNQPVLFNLPVSPEKRNCLRIAGIPGDTISIDSGIVKNCTSLFKPPKTNPALDIIPADYAPRDFIGRYVIPKPGDILNLDSMNIRDLFFAISLIRQELRKDKIQITAKVMIDDTARSDYIIKGFSLYSGSLPEIPDSLQNYWFFWTQLENYLKSLHPDNHVSLKFNVQRQNNGIHKYTVKRRHYFLLADNWVSGYDSRYFGLVEQSYFLGRPFMIWWSTAKISGHSSISRIGRIIL